MLCGWWMSHLELNWRDPRFRAFVEALGRHRTVIRYDVPGTGVSADGAAPDATVEGEAAALAAVVEASGAPSVDLFAASSGSPVGIAFATAHPERVGKLLIYAGLRARRPPIPACSTTSPMSAAPSWTIEQSSRRHLDFHRPGDRP